MSQKKVIIIGAGFAGLEAAKCLGNSSLEIILIDKTNHHLFQPLLYQVATAVLSPSDIATSTRNIVASYKNITCILGEVTAIDKERSQISLSDGTNYSFDWLIVAPGARHSYFGHPEWEEHAPGLKTLADAITIREKILLAFEKAEKARTYEEALREIRFCIIGAGPTGVELAGSIAEIAFRSMPSHFRFIQPKDAKVYLIEGMSQVLPGYPETLSNKAKISLEKLGVQVLLNKKVTQINEQGLFFGEEHLPASCIIWAAGNQASPLLKTLNAELDKQGRCIVDKNLNISGFDNIFVLGDAACVLDKNNKPLPGLAPVAKQQGKYAAHIIYKNIEKAKRKNFVYYDKGSLATIGRGKAVGMIGKLKISGFLAWFAWCFIHIFYLIGFKNRLFVLIQWLSTYIANKPKVLLITRIEKNNKIR